MRPTSQPVRCDVDPPGAPEVAGGVHADDENQGRQVMENTGPVVAKECLTPHPGCGAESLSDQGSPVHLAQRPPQVSLSGQDSEMSSPNMDSSLGTACTVVAPSQSSTDGSQPCNSPPSGKKAMPRDPNPMPAAKRVRLGADGAAAIECDDPNQKVELDKIKAPAGRELPTIRQLKLRLARDEYVAGACFFYATALSLHALRSQTPLTGVDLRVQATTMYRERCGIEVKESALSVCRALEENNWEGKPWGGRPDHFRHLAHHIDGKVVLLRTNTPKIMDSRFGPDTAVTSAAVWSPGMGEAKVYHTIQEMEEACEQACVIVVGEAERDGLRPGGHYRCASYDRSLQVAPLCVLHGIMGTLLYTRETLGQFSLRRLQWGVGGSKGHTAKGDCRRSRLVQGTQEHGPLVMMVNRIARKLVPEWFTWTTIKLSSNETTAPHQHRFDSPPWSAVFSTGRHVGGEIRVEEGGVGSGPHGRPGRRQCPHGISRPGHKYRVDRQPVVVRTGAWHATCPWKGDRRLVVLYGRASHRIRWSEANARRNKVFLANVPWVARHLDSKTHLTTKEEDVWEDCHDAGLLSWAVVYGDILHGTRSFNNVAQLHAPTGGHLTKATEMLQARVEKVAREEGPRWTQFKEQTVTGAWHGVELVQFDTDGQRCTTSPPFPATEARAVTDTLLAGIREGQGTIDPRGVLECAVLLDHGRWLALPAADRATFGVDLLKQFMGTHHAELAAAHVNAARALEEWESFKEHVVRTFAKTPMSRMWEALTPEREHVQ